MDEKETLLAEISEIDSKIFNLQKQRDILNKQYYSLNHGLKIGDIIKDNNNVRHLVTDFEYYWPVVRKEIKTGWHKKACAIYGAWELVGHEVSAD
jgi:hypothetical protein